MTTFEVTRDEVVFAVGSPVSFDVVPVVASFTTGPPAGVDGTSFTPRGPWDSGATYAVGDVVSFSGGNYILYASPPTGGDPDVDTAHWDAFGSSSAPDASTSVKGIVQLEDSVASTSTTKAATPKNVKEAYDLAAAAQPADSDLTAIAGATLSGDGYLKRASGAWSLDTPSGGGGSLPSPTGEVGAVLGVDESETYALQRYIQYGDGDAYAVASVQTDRVRLEAADGLGGIAGVNVYMDGSVGIETTGPVTVAPGDGFRVVGDFGATVLNGDDYLMETASDTGVQAPGATYNRSRGSLGSEAAVENGDTLAVPLYAQGHDGTSLVLAATITAEVDGTVATGKVPTRIRIATADSDGVLTDRMILGADGTTDVLGDFTVNGSPVSGGGGGGGGLVLVDSGTFSAATSGSPAAVPGGSFASGYNYLLDVLITNPTSGDALRGRFVASGTAESGSVYMSGQHYILVPVAHGAQAWSGQTSMLWGSTGRRRGRIKMEISGAADTDYTTWKSDYSYTDDSTHAETGFYGGGVDSTTAYDAFQWWPDSASSVSGSWRLYRYAT